MGKTIAITGMRYASDCKIGDAGAVYEFNVKIRNIDNAENVTEEEFEILRDDSLIEFSASLLRRYSWIGKTYFTGRSGGWLAIEDVKGLATRSKLETIVGLVLTARNAFKKRVQEFAADKRSQDLV